MQIDELLRHKADKSISDLNVVCPSLPEIYVGSEMYSKDDLQCLPAMDIKSVLKPADRFWMCRKG